jgi:hypothetical protein
MAGERSGNALKAGRVVIDNSGIVQARRWGLFGTRFKLCWSDIISWNVKDQVLLDRSTGEERVISHVLSIFHNGGFQVISRPAGDRQFPLIADKVRQHLPDKENYPVAFDPLEIMNRLQLPANGKQPEDFAEGRRHASNTLPPVSSGDRMKTTAAWVATACLIERSTTNSSSS